MCSSSQTFTVNMRGVCGGKLLCTALCQILREHSSLDEKSMDVELLLRLQLLKELIKYGGELIHTEGPPVCRDH